MPFDKVKLAQEPFWSLQKEKVLDILQTSTDGLTDIDAADRLAYFGRNILPRKKGGLKIRIFLRQFKSPLIIILIAAGTITLFLKDFKTSGFIFAAIFVNAALGFYQENKAATALESLETYIRERIRVIRGGKEREIDAEEVVPGDIIRLVSGARVPADARLIMVNELFVDEAVLTGESLPVLKTTNPVRENATVADQESLVFSGTLVSGGVGLAVVVRAGADTELGRIAASNEPS